MENTRKRQTLCRIMRGGKYLRLYALPIFHTPVSQGNYSQIKNKKRLSKVCSAPGYSSKQGSITVEASLAFSLFFFFCCLFLSLFSAVQLQLRLQKALDEVCERVAVYSYAVIWSDKHEGVDFSAILPTGKGEEETKRAGDKAGGTKTLIHEQMQAMVWKLALKEWLIAGTGRDYLEASPLKTGCLSLSLWNSTWKNDEIDLVLSYVVQLPVPVPFPVSFIVTQRSCRRLWTGEGAALLPGESQSGEEIYVLVTETGRVYHTTHSCSRLTVRISQLAAEELDRARNSSGGKYYPCERCHAVPEGVVYITADGTKFHGSANCSGLKRSVREILLSEAQASYAPCSFCAGKGDLGG